ncbi:MAG: hypothetical protein AAF218_09645 [Pseudomonadota bacterium]
MLLTGLAACAAAVPDIERFEDVALLDTAANRAALPDAAEVADDTPVLTQLITEAASAEAAPPLDAPRPGLLGRFMQRVRAAPTDPLPADIEDTASVEATRLPVPPQDAAALDLAEDAEAPRRGMFGLFRGARSDPDPALAREAALSPDPALPKPARADGPKLSRAAQGRAADVRDVDYGAVLPFGEIARSCAAKRQALGRKVDKAARTQGYTLFDSDPDSTAPRTWYVTGFDDGCPRQFTAALAMFGAPSMHEQLRYGLPAEQYPYSDTDKAYETIKTRICGVPRRKPCGRQIAAVERTTVFISAYESFEDNVRWADMLLHDGAVMASAIKTP